MSKLNTIFIAALLALAAVLGTIAATRTVSLGASAQQTSAASLHAKARRLDAYAASIQRALAKRAPPLPAAASSAGPRVVYHRPPPIVIVKHHHGDDSSEGADD
jgi:hypothetical protein